MVLAANALLSPPRTYCSKFSPRVLSSSLILGKLGNFPLAASVKPAREANAGDRCAQTADREVAGAICNDFELPKNKTARCVRALYHVSVHLSSIRFWPVAEIVGFR